LIGEIDGMGGAVAAIEQGWVQSAIADAAYAHQRASRTWTSVPWWG
jgi:methylmalonyl-CoA mutase N-terminal domain/subunit